MSSIGEIIRKLRKEKRLSLKIVAAYLNTDDSVLSKIERGKRRANRVQVLKLAELFNVDAEELLVAWLSDEVLHVVANENIALKALKVAEEKYRMAEKLQ
jgi:transcriptional regulator with XRE-family HTH domain